ADASALPGRFLPNELPRLRARLFFGPTLSPRLCGRVRRWLSVHAGFDVVAVGVDQEGAVVAAAADARAAVVAAAEPDTLGVEPVDGGAIGRGEGDVRRADRRA